MADAKIFTVNFVVMLLIGFVVADTMFKDCGSTGKVMKLKLLDCKEPPCILKQNSSVTALLHFKTSENGVPIEKITSSFAVQLTPEIEIPFPTVRNDVCSRLKNAPKEYTTDATVKGCPIAPGSEVVYYTILNITDDYPMLQADIKWSLTDQANNKVACVEVLCQLV